jgi:alpha-ketoglutarate-dependent taurine dioxygenase
VQGGNQIRPAQSGPVFSVDPLSGDLHMRYTARTRSIQWKDDALTREAVQCLEHTLSNSEDYVVHHRLGPGEGVISNNVLHSRTPFENGPAEDQQRLMYRARYYDRVNQTSVHS